MVNAVVSPMEQMTAKGKRKADALRKKLENGEGDHVPPVSLLRARFIHYFGFEAYYSRRWETRDGCVPWPVFYLLLAGQRAIDAGFQFRMSMSISHAITLGFGDEDAQRGAVDIGNLWLAQSDGAPPPEIEAPDNDD